ncbi:POTRA domain-containing protein [Blattabacterium sp. (Blattella germanica)]|uniref:BamA/OMP85 family outer membrane protein n=1 Tax=Blattabacterium sp. (Blattella germanica) TaxID=624186 RepID=UPI001D040135|nr:POTRA domain-containing protein [Blattabacterium sp. (Blattella germanica)]
MQIQQGYSFIQKKDFNISKNEISNLVVKSVHIMGKTKYDSPFISDLSGIYSGDFIDSYGIKIDSAIKKLWKSNLFKNISIYKKNISKNEIDLFFELEDLIEIHEVQVKGIRKEQFSNIKKLKSGDKISDDLIQTIKNDIQEYYIQKGYNEINIKNEIIRINDKNILFLSVDKGKKIEIEKILFEGNHLLNDKELLHLMIKTKKSFFIPIIEKSIYLFVQENIRKDFKNIADKYKSMGFIDIQVFLDSVWKEKSGNYGIKIKLVEGNRYFLGKVDFLGNKKLKTNFLKKIFFHKEGNIYNQIEIERNILDASFPTSILYTYLDLGYLFVNIIPVEKRVVDDKIDLEIQIKENQPVYIKKVKISGNLITKDHVIRRELKTYPGTLFSPKNMRYSLLNLENLNLFDKVYSEIHTNQENNSVDIEWHIVEKNTNEFQVHGGLGGKDLKKVIGNFKLNFGNFSLKDFFKWKLWNPIPQGDGQKLVVFSQLGKDFTSYGFSFTEPWIERRNPTSLTLKGNYSINKMKNEEDFYFLSQIYKNSKIEKKQFLELKKVGGSVNLNKFLTFLDPYSAILTSVDYDKFIFNKTISSDFYQKHEFHNLSCLISLQRLYTFPDSIFPFKGSKIQLNSTFTLPYSMILKNYDKNNIKWMEYYKFKIIFFWYQKIIENMVFKIGSEFGYLGQYNHSKELFPFQKFYIGGVQNNFMESKLEEKDHIPLRGYSFSTPNHGGVIYNKLILEMRYLIKNFSTLKIWTTFFMEGGNVSDSYKKFHPFIMNKSFGFGVRLFWNPIGFIGVDFGYPIDGTQSKWKTHFIIGKDL